MKRRAVDRDSLLSPSDVAHDIPNDSKSRGGLRLRAMCSSISLADLLTAVVVIVTVTAHICIALGALSPHTFGLDRSKAATSISCLPNNAASSAPPEGSESCEGAESHERIPVQVVIGIQTGFGSASRRKALRESWVPSSEEQLSRLEDEHGLVIRFVIGQTQRHDEESNLAREIQEHGQFIRLDVEEHYLNLNYKSREYFKAVFKKYDARYYAKIDDDVYLFPMRLLHVLKDPSLPHSAYLGCMKKGAMMPKGTKWHEKNAGRLLGKDEYHVHAWGPAYILSHRAVHLMTSIPDSSLRYFTNEDLTVGTWILMLNVTHVDDRRLCHTKCNTNSLVVYGECAGATSPSRGHDIACEWQGHLFC